MDGLRVLAIFTLCPLAAAAAHLIRARRDPQLQWYRYVRAAAWIVLACAFFVFVWFRVEGTIFYVVVGCGVAALVISPWIAHWKLHRTRNHE